MHRGVRTAFLLMILGLPLAGCGALGGGYDFDPTDLIPGDIFNSKKKLPGERKAVFPEGVPGTTRGVPPELVKGYQATETAIAPEPVASVRQSRADARRPNSDGGVGLPREEAKPKAPPKAQAKVTPKTTTAATQTGQQSVDERWPDTPPPQQQRQAPPQRQAQQPPQPPGGTQWPDPPGARSQQSGPGFGGGQVQWPDPPAR